MKRFWISMLVLILCLSSVTTFADEEMTITVFLGGQDMPAPEEDVILPQLEEYVGVNLEWNVISSEYDTQMNVRLAGGNVPDIFQINMVMAPMYAEQGLLLDIEPYLDKMPHFKAAYKPEYLKNCYVNDGMYMVAGRPYIPYCNYSIRTDWLEAVGMQVPTTLE